jgi:hypothetical protein
VQRVLAFHRDTCRTSVDSGGGTPKQRRPAAPRDL